MGPQRNSGGNVTVEQRRHADAVAAVDDEPPMTADESTWAEIVGYRRVLTYVLNVAIEPGFVIDETVLRSMHFPSRPGG